MIRGRPFGRMRSGIASWHPRQLFVGGVAGALYLPRPETCRVMSDGTGNPAVVGDPIGWLADESGGNRHATQATTAAKPILRQDAAGRYYLEFDGVQQFLQAAYTLSAYPVTLVAAARSQANQAGGLLSLNESDSSYKAIWKTVTADQWAVNDRKETDLSATLSAFVDVNRLFIAAFDTAAFTLAVDGGSPSAGTPNTNTFGSPAALHLGRLRPAGAFFQGRLYAGLAIAALLATIESTRLRTFLAAWAGVSL